MVSSIVRGSSAFTLLELLITLSIIALLAGLLLAASGPIRQKALATKTQTTLITVQGALATTALHTGSTPTPAEHPLFATRGSPSDERLLFVRSSDGSACSTSFEDVYRNAGFPENLLLTSLTVGAKALLDSDVFSGGEIGDPRDSMYPACYGARRDRLTIPGGTVPAMTISSYQNPDYPSKRIYRLTTFTRYRMLSWSDPNKNGTAESAELSDAVARAATDQQLVEPLVERLVDSSVFHDVDAMRRFGLDDASAALERILSASGAADELRSLGALSAPKDDLSAHRIIGSRLWSDDDPPAPRWDPGRVRVGANGWVKARLPPLAIYDAWGREIFYHLDPASEGPVLTSAGRDGVLVWSPGKDGVYQTDPHAQQAAGDDVDGTNDNISSANVR